MAVHRHSGLRNVLRTINQTWPALVVLGLGLVISLFAWRLTEQRVDAEASREFQQLASRAVELIDRRVQDNVNLLLGLKGLFNASDSVSRREFQLYLSSFQMERRYSIIRILSYSRYVRQADRTAFEQHVRGDTSIDPRGYPAFAIKPPGERADYTVIEYLEPHAGNEVAFGLDLSADPVRRADIERTRDLGEAVASGPLAAAINPNHISFSLRVAIYKPGMPTHTLEQRHAAFQGVVAAVIHVDELMTSLFGTQLSNDFELVVHDVGPWSAPQSEKPSKQNLLYDSRFLGGVNAESGGGPFRQVAVIDVAGRKWRMSFSLPEGVHGVERSLPMVVLIGGLLTSLLLFWIVWALQVSRSRALALAEHTRAARATEGLREQLAFIQQLIEAVPQPIFRREK